jgi:RNase HII (EC 3.1.26.4)
MLKSHYHTDCIEAGCDEAGRGCLAGSVFAAAVILPPDYHNAVLNDSKQLTEKQRYALRDQVQHDAVAWAVGVVTPDEIDKINILHASFLAMHRAIDQLAVRPEALIIDGNRFDPYYPPLPLSTQPIRPSSGWASPSPSGKGRGEALPHTCIVKGDGKYLSIAAASILAKTYRDDYMRQLADEYPMYAWDRNKGYPTKAHREAIRKYGISPFHRRSFQLLPIEQLEFNFE